MSNRTTFKKDTNKPNKTKQNNKKATQETFKPDLNSIFIEKYLVKMKTFLKNNGFCVCVFLIYNTCFKIGI